MTKSTNEQQSTSGNCNRIRPCCRPEEAQLQERWESQLSHLKHRRCRNIIPDWMKRWALGR